MFVVCRFLTRSSIAFKKASLLSKKKLSSCSFPPLLKKEEVVYEIDLRLQKQANFKAEKVTSWLFSKFPSKLKTEIIKRLTGDFDQGQRGIGLTHIWGGVTPTLEMTDNQVQISPIDLQRDLLKGQSGVWVNLFLDFRSIFDDFFVADEVDFSGIDDRASQFRRFASRGVIKFVWMFDEQRRMIRTRIAFRIRSGQKELQIWNGRNEGINFSRKRRRKIGGRWNGSLKAVLTRSGVQNLTLSVYLRTN